MNYIIAPEERVVLNSALCDCLLMTCGNEQISAGTSAAIKTATK